MASVPTPFPQSLIETVQDFFKGSRIDILWKAFVFVLLSSVIYYLVALGGIFYVFLGTTILSIWLSDNLQEWVKDIWNRNFWVWRK